MKQTITKKSTFHSKAPCEQHELLVNTEFRVQRLERLIEDLLVWREGSDLYNRAVEEYNQYVEEENRL